MVRSVLLGFVLLGSAASAQVVPPTERRCPSPQLPAGSLTFSSGESSPFGPTATFTVRVDGQHLYWCDGRGQLWRAPKSGGSATRIVAEHAHNFLLLDGTIYYTSEKSIRRVAAGGGAPSVVVQESESPIALASDGRFLFYSMYDGSPVRQLELASGKVLRRIPVSGQVMLAIEGGQLYVASYRQGTITRHPVVGKKPPRLLVRGERTLVGVSVDEAAIYYSVEKGGFVKRLPKEGGRALTLAQGMDNQETLVLDGPHLYWFDWTGSAGQHTLWRALRTGSGKPERVQGGLCGPHYLAVDEGSLYIANKGAGTVIKIPKLRK
jgi:hypothetical protein